MIGSTAPIQSVGVSLGWRVGRFNWLMRRNEGAAPVYMQLADPLEPARRAAQFKRWKVAITGAR